MFDTLIDQIGLFIPIFGILLMILLLIIIPFYNFLKGKKLEKSIRDVTVQVKQDFIRRKEQEEANKRRIAESLSMLEAKHSDFLKSTERMFIERFSRKFGNTAQETDLLKLQSLLNTFQWNFSLDELKLLIDKEFKTQRFENIKAQMMANTNQNRREIIKIFIDKHNIDDEKILIILADVIKEKGLSFTNLNDLKTEIVEIKEKIEAEEFAKFLLNDSHSLESFIHESQA